MLDTLHSAVRFLAAELDGRFCAVAPSRIVRTAIEDVFPGRIALVSSFGADSAVLLHMVSRVNAATPVIFLETGKHFDETLRFRKDLVERLGLLNVIDRTPASSELGRHDPDGELHRRDPDACCTLRKVWPLQDALAQHAAWFTGRRRDQTAARRRMPVVEAEGPRLKINPLAGWTEDDVSDYLAAHDLPRHPLVPLGYRSIGCAPCTAPARGEDARAGRWAGRLKTECGIHGPRG
jgi:phosphoadenosine phosphosulfate reductase